MRQSLKNWAACNYIHGGSCAYGAGQYDNGAWSVADGWIAETVAETETSLAARLVIAFANSSNPTQEYWAWGGPVGATQGIDFEFGVAYWRPEVCDQ